MLQMMMMLSAVKKATGEEVDGYFDTCVEGGVTYGGFMRYLNLLGYTHVKIYAANTRLTDAEKGSFTNFQKQFGEAIASIEYYPPCPYHDYLRRTYAKAHPVNQDFKQPEFKRGGIY